MAIPRPRRALAVLALACLAAACSTSSDTEDIASAEREAAPAAPGGHVGPEDLRHPVIATRRDVIERKFRAALALFSYERAAPLGTRHEAPPITYRAYIHHEISYASPRGGRVEATLLIPRGQGPWPALVIQHGMPGTRSDVLPDATRYAAAGVATISIDAPFARRGGSGLAEPITFTHSDRRDQIQLIVDLQRAVDLLVERNDIDADRVGYMGISYGAAMGGLLAGVETRISAYVLAVGDGGIVEHFTGPEDDGGPLDSLPPARRRSWLESMEPIEPIYFIGQAEPAHLLLQSADFDEAVWEADAIRYQHLASEPKDIRWYQSGHFLPDEARCDSARWLGEQLGLTKMPRGYCSADQ